MAGGEDSNRFEHTVNDLKEFACLYYDRLKLKLLDSFATVATTMLNTMLYILSILIAIVFLAGGITLWLGEMIGSTVGALFIMAGIFLIVALFIYAMRRRLFVNNFVRMFRNIMFDTDKNDEDDDEE